jgi:hypothetical protein
VFARKSSAPYSTMMPLSMTNYWLGKKYFRRGFYRLFSSAAAPSSSSANTMICSAILTA